MENPKKRVLLIFGILIAIVVAGVIIFGLLGGQGGPDPTNPTTTVPTTQGADPTNPTTEPAGTTAPPETVPTPPAPPPPPSLDQYGLYKPIFAESVIRQCQVKQLGSAAKQALMVELERILANKQYGEEHNALIRDTVECAIDGQAQFQMLFAFLNPHDTATYIRKYIFEPLESMVDEIRICDQSNQEDMDWLHAQYGEDASYAGFADENAKRIVIVWSDLTLAIETLVHELHHMAVLKDHSKVYPDNVAAHLHMTEGAATLYQLTLSGYYYHDTLTPFIDQFFPDPEQENHYLAICGMSGGAYARWSSAYFKLLALTDFATMDLFLNHRGDLQIREDLVRRYGEEGGAFYDGLFSLTDFEKCVESEALFLKLFSSRINEVDSAAEAASYATLYRFYCKVFCNRYMGFEQEEAGFAQIEHPSLPLQELEQCVAEELVKWSCMNAKDENTQRILAHLASRSYVAYYHVDYMLLYDAYYLAVPAANGETEIGVMGMGVSATLKYRYSPENERIYWQGYV